MTNRENPIHRIKSYLGSGSKSKRYGSETLINWLNNFRMKKLPLSVAVDIGGNTKEDIKCVVTVSLHSK